MEPDEERADAALPAAVAAVLRSVAEAEAATHALLPTAADVREQIDAAEKEACGDGGTSAKSGGVIAQLQKLWREFAETHGDAYGLDASVGPTVDFVLHFQTWGFFNRTNFSTVGLDGMGDSWGQLAVPYLRTWALYPLSLPGAMAPRDGRAVGRP